MFDGVNRAHGRKGSDPSPDVDWQEKLAIGARSLLASLDTRIDEHEPELYALEPIEDLSILAKQLGHHPFTKPERLARAVAHDSTKNQLVETNGDLARWTDHGKKMGELGGDMIKMIVAHQLYTQFEKKMEGDMTRCGKALLHRQSLAMCCDDIGISPFIRVDTGQDRSTYVQEPGIRAEATCRVIGALVEDAGAEKTIELLSGFFAKRASSGQWLMNPRVMIGEVIQAAGLPALSIYHDQLDVPNHRAVHYGRVKVPGYPDFRAEAYAPTKSKAVRKAGVQLLRTFAALDRDPPT